MAIINLEYYSEVLGMNRNVKVIYPEASKVKGITESDIPVLYLLHGMSGNENSWLSRSGIDRLVRKTNVAIVMPSTDLGFYVNTTYGMNYFDATAIELPKVIHNFFPHLSTKREKNFIAGLSMGGYGAFRLALGTNSFSYAASLSGYSLLMEWKIVLMKMLPIGEGFSATGNSLKAQTMKFYHLLNAMKEKNQNFSLGVASKMNSTLVMNLPHQN